MKISEQLKEIYDTLVNVKALKSVKLSQEEDFKLGLAVGKIKVLAKELEVKGE
jgi:hypothetical protein